MIATSYGTEMPIFLDRHDLSGLTATDIAEAHRNDLEIQEQYGVRFLTYWFDEARGTGFCLIDSPDMETAMRVHGEAHGDVATDVIPVDLSAVEAFLGHVSDPAPAAPEGKAVLDAAFRAVMFTDIVDSTGMTSRLGDVRGVEMVRAHDSIVRRSLKDAGGCEVKHTGDGIMASFNDADSAVACGCSIQKSLDTFNSSNAERLQVRIGIHAGEPIEESNDLFGVTVQTAARVCHEADGGSVVISAVVRGALNKDLNIIDLGARSLKGIPDPVPLFQVVWR